MVLLAFPDVRWERHLPPGANPDLPAALVAEGSLPAAWVRRWAEEPARPVLHDAGRWTTAAELEERSRQVAGRLAGAGLRAGDRLVTSAGTSIDLVVAHVAALRLGLVVVPVNGAYREREIAHIVRDARPSAALVDDRERGGWVETAAVGPVLVLGPEVALPDADAPDLDRAGVDDGALLCYTSGTTGVPKGALLTHGNILSSPAALQLAWRWSPDDRLVLALPLFHMHGLGVGLHGTLLVGASAVLQPTFAVETVLDAAREHRASLFFGVPTMYERLARSSRVAELGALRLCVSGSAPLPADLHARLATAAGTAVIERYGLTETVMNASNPYDGERRAGTVGFPLPGVEIRLGTGEEILVRGPNVFPGYWDRPDATAESFDAEGWFATGDIGAFDADGYLSIVGRSKELIITGGFNVYPREVEDVLRAFTGVADVAVVGVPSDEWGEVVTAVVVPDGAVDADALLAFAADELAPYKRPRAVRFVDELPRNALGKVLRNELR
ncbi:MAG TPA: AMP-binding protein [Acidimicrobiia bacterium]